MYTLAVTAFDEMTSRRDYGKKLLRCIRPAQSHEAISQIVVVDDGSENFAGLQRLLDKEPKVSLYRNISNRGVFGNKIEAIARACEDWVINCDSDNVMDQHYLDRITTLSKEQNTWYSSSFARPQFDYRDLAGSYNVISLKKIVNHRIFACFFNTGNQTVHRDSFLDVFEKYRDRRADLMMPNYLNLPEKNREEHYWRLVFDACDSFIFNMNWILFGGNIAVVNDLEYDHYFTTGEEGNYGRSPQEKSDLENILLRRLKEKVEQ